MENKLVNITKKRQTHRYKLVVTSEGRSNRGVREWKAQNIRYKTQGCTVQHKEYRQYFIVTINGIEPLKLY